jgi:hypothetical protein
VREPEWLDSDVRELMELADVEAHSCDSCGWHESVTGDRSNVFTPESDVCPVCAGKERWDRMVADGDRRWTEKHKDARPSEPRPFDGRGHTRMTLLSPEEAERRRGGGSGDQG